MNSESIDRDLDLAHGVVSGATDARSGFFAKCGDQIAVGYRKGVAEWGRFSVSRFEFRSHVSVRACESYLRVGAANGKRPGIQERGRGRPNASGGRTNSRDFPGLGAFVSGLVLRDVYLALACSGGDDSAWEKFDDHFGDFLRRCSRQLVRRTGPAEDVASSFYADLYLPRSETDLRNALAHFAGRARLKTWLRTVLFFRVGDHFERARRDPTPLTELNLEEDSIQERVVVGGACVRERPDPGESYERRDRLNVLARVLPREIQALEPREIWLLREYFENGKTVEEIGRGLGVHRATVSRRLQRIRSELLDRVLSRAEFDWDWGEGGVEGDGLIHQLALRLDFEDLFGKREP